MIFSKIFQNDFTAKKKKVNESKKYKNIFFTLNLEVKSKISLDLNKLWFGDYGYQNSTKYYSNPNCYEVGEITRAFFHLVKSAHAILIPGQISHATY